MELRRLARGETDIAAALHRRAGATIPGYDVALHTPEQDRAFYREQVFAKGPIWGVLADAQLLGHVALSPGWIDHLYVEPEHHRRGVGRMLVGKAQEWEDELQLWTFQANLRARTFYERHGFVAETFTDGSGNEERLPDVRYRWRRG